MDSTQTVARSAFVLPPWAVSVLTGLMVILIPVILVLLSVRVVLTETYVKLLYQRPGFPADLYGWDDDVRLEYGPIGVRYLTTDEDISLLGDLVIDGRPAFKADELNHMEDVHVVTLGAMRVLYASLALFAVVAGALAYSPQTRPALWGAISHGGFATIGLILMLFVVVIVSWDFFFDTFHALFFEDGTWQFRRSDTLIRLYPQQFWFDSSIVVGIITIGGALLCGFLPRWWMNRKARVVEPDSESD